MRKSIHCRQRTRKDGAIEADLMCPWPQSAAITCELIDGMDRSFGFIEGDYCVFTLANARAIYRLEPADVYGIRVGALLAGHWSEPAVLPEAA